MLLSEKERSSEATKKTVLLKTLSDEYCSTVFALKATSLTTMSFDDIVQRLKETELGLVTDTEAIARIARTKQHRLQDHSEGRKKLPP
jgi:hypothetical protein